MCNIYLFAVISLVAVYLFYQKGVYMLSQLQDMLICTNCWECKFKGHGTVFEGEGIVSSAFIAQDSPLILYSIAYFLLRSLNRVGIGIDCFQELVCATGCQEAVATLNMV